MLSLAVILTVYFTYKSIPEPAEQLNYQPVIIQHGDTLWELAENTGIQMDTHRLVLKIMVYNSLANSTILPGQTIYIPTSR
jgi:LysM domain.